MTEADTIYLLARLYIRLRLDGCSSNMRPIYHELIDLLSERAGRNVEQTTDSNLVDILRPRATQPDEPGIFKPKGKVAPKKDKEN